MCIKNEKIISCFFSLMVKCIAAFITLLKPFMGRSGGGEGGEGGKGENGILL